MGRPNKTSGFSDKLIENYGSADYMIGFENDGTNVKYPLDKVADYAAKKRPVQIGSETKTLASHIEGVKSGISSFNKSINTMNGTITTQNNEINKLKSRTGTSERNITELQTDMANQVAALTLMNSKVNAIESGPLTAATVAAMTNTSKVYVYTGSESGYVNGNWYYYDGSHWVSGGVYNSTAINLDTTLSVADMAAEGKAVGDALSAMDEQKANVDGVYESMTVGNAEQLIGSVFTEDDTPYNFRTAGGAIDIGDREIDKLVGGTVAWNQWIRNGNFANTDYWIAFGESPSISVSNNVLTFTIANASEGVRCTGLKTSFQTGHKVLSTIDVLSSSNEIMFRVSGSFSVAKHNSGLSSWETIAAIGVSDGNSYMFLVRDDRTSDFDAVSIRNAMMIDLTQMFGSTIANYIYSLEQATAGAGVAWFRKLFPKPYYPYNAGELMSVEATAHVTRGFNAWDEEWEHGYYSRDTGVKAGNSDTTYFRSKNFIPCLPETYYHFVMPQSHASNNTYFAVLYYDADKNYLGNKLVREFPSTNTVITLPNAYYMTFYVEVGTSGAYYNNDICVSLHWDGERDGEYEEYKEHVYPLDSNLTLRGIPKLDASNKLYYDGDTYESDGRVVRKYGTLTASGRETVTTGTSSNYNFFDIDTQAAMDAIAWETKVFTNIWPSIAEVHVAGLTIAVQLNASKKIRISLPSSDTTFQSVDALKTYLTSHPLTVLYPLAEPVEETAAPYQNPQVVDDFGTEEYVDSRTVPIPVGHETKYANNLRAKLEMAPDSPDGSGDYIVRQSNGQNEYVPLVIPKELPNTPSEDGIYHLKVTVVNGAAGLSWESEA